MKFITFVIVMLLSFSSIAVETLSVLVVYDTNSTTNLTALNTETKRATFASSLVTKLKNSFQTSLSGDISFTLVKQQQSIFKTSTNLTNQASVYRANMLNSAQNKNLLTLNSLQRTNQADIVLAVMQSNQQSTSDIICGEALMIPSQNVPVNYPSTLTNQAFMKHPDLGIVFIEADFLNCLNKEFLVAHEVGHGMGLTHHDDNLTPRFFGAKGYVKNGGLFGTTFGTVMAGGSFTGTRHNLFSNPQIWGCGNQEACGDTESNSASVLKQFKTHYNARGLTSKLF